MLSKQMNDFLRTNIYYFCRRPRQGEMAEWSNAAVSKTVVRLPVDRGFESPSLRNDKLLPSATAEGIFILQQVEPCPA